MSVRIYTLLSAEDKERLTKRAAEEDRSESKIIARSVEADIPVSLKQTVPAVSTGDRHKVFARVPPKTAQYVKNVADDLGWHEWQVVNACLQNYLHA